MKKAFESVRDNLERQFADPNWIAGSGLSVDELNKEVLNIEGAEASRAIIKAKTLSLLTSRARLAVDTDDIFQDKFDCAGIMAEQRERWAHDVKYGLLAEDSEIADFAKECCLYTADGDYGHTSPNTTLMLSVGLTGLLEQVELASSAAGLTEKQKDFYTSCKIALGALITAAKRLSDAVRPYNEENADALASIASGAPKNIYEAMQLIILYFFVHEYVGATRVRTLGRLDMLLMPFYERDIASGRYTKEEIKDMLRYFLNKFWVAKVPFDLPFCLGGIDKDGRDVTSDMTYLIAQTYDELNIYSPKIHIRVADSTPRDFVKLILSFIRGGNSSFVFVNDNIGIESLKRVGIDESDARNYVPIGCYEPAVWGVELGCTGNGGLNLPKVIEIMLCGGREFTSGRACGIEMPKPESFDQFIAAYKEQVKHLTEEATSYIKKIEEHYGEINPDPLLSCQYENSVAVGVDLYEGGAKYNSSSFYFYFIASAIDSLCAIKKLVYDEQVCTLTQMSDILKNNWVGHEKLRARALRLEEKYGNNDPVADALTREISSFCADLVNNKPNARGGVFKAAMFSIDFGFPYGKQTMATPDGRRLGDPLSKNLCASYGMDRCGITALINSVCQIDHASLPTGSVLDIVVHPSSVMGEDGLDAFYGILMTYFKKGGFAMHGNVFSAEKLRAAQQNPEKYKNLQVRVCGWNVYFVNLSKEEQNAFIRQAEGN